MEHRAVDVLGELVPRSPRERELLGKIAASHVLAVQARYDGNATAAHACARAAFDALRSFAESAWATADAPAGDRSRAAWLSQNYDDALARTSRVLVTLALTAWRAQGGQDASGSAVLRETSESLTRVRNCAYRNQRFLVLLASSAASYRLYFRQENLLLSREVSSAVLRYEEEVLASRPPKGLLCTFWFWHGVCMVREKKLPEAQKALEEALRLCKPSSQRNLSAILAYLVPLRILRGDMPRADALFARGIGHLAPLIAAVHAGDVAAASEQLDSQMDLFLQQGIYLLLEEKLLWLAHRNFLKRFVEVQRSIGGHEAQIRLAHVRDVLAALGCDQTVVEVHCTIANLILKKLVKGYIGGSVPTLVVAKGSIGNAFPKIAPNML